MRLKHFFTITAIIAVCGCSVNEKDIRCYGREGNVDLLVRTIDKGYQKQKRHAKVKLAIEQIAKLDHQALNMINRAAQEWSASSPAQRRQLIATDTSSLSLGDIQRRLQDMADNEAKALAKAPPEARLEMILYKATGHTKETLAKTENGGAIIATVLWVATGFSELNIDEMSFKETFKENEAWNYLLYRFDHGFTDDLISHTLLAPSSTSNLNTLQKQFLQHIREGDYAAAQALVSIAARVGIADDEIPLSVQDQLLVTLNTQTRLDSLRDLQRKAERSIGYYQDKIEKGRELGGKYFPLQGYIVAQVVLGLYEIQIAYFGGLGGHAYLQTTETRFKGRGQFTLWAYELMEMPVTLRQEFGGFTQQWKVYREATSDQIREMREAKESLSAAEDSIVVRQKALDSLEPVISSESEAFDSALGQLTIIFEETFGYSHVGVD